MSRCWLLWMVACACGAGYAEEWVEDTFDDFADGRLDAGGQNIYVAKEGSVRTIHRFDLNGDGYLDLPMNSTHDLKGILPSTAAWIDAGTPKHAPLAVEGSLAVALGDLNQDGFMDLAFCPNRQGVQHPRRLVTTIYGGPDGWPATRANGILPVSDPKAIALPDLNHDGWLDIAVLNGPAWLPDQGKGNILRAFWGGPSGFLLSAYRDFGSVNALDIAAADFDLDGAADIAVLKSDHTVDVYWATEGISSKPPDLATIVLPDGVVQCLSAADWDADGRAEILVGSATEAVHLAAFGPGKKPHALRTLHAASASHLSVGDLDGDGAADLVATQVAIAHASGGEAIGTDKDQAGRVRVFWGKDGDLDPQSTDLAAPQATATAIGDLNGDGRADLAVAVYQGAALFDTQGLLFAGTGARNLECTPWDAPISGATDVAIAAPEQGLPARAVFANSAGGTPDERIPTVIYLGGRHGFRPDRKIEIPFVSGYEASAADLNQDGFTDFIAMCSGHLGPGAASLTELGANIFWGTAKGIDPASEATVLRESNLYSSNVADFDRDGYLDLALGAFDPPKPGEKDILVVYYGGAEGFKLERRVAIPSEGRSSMCTIADFNDDQWLDIAVTSFNKDLVRIFWGGEAGFSEANQTNFPAPSPIELETADLNADGHLDLLVGSYYDRISGAFDTGTLIFWGSEAGYAPANSQWLPGSAPLGYTVADFDGDGYLDLFSPSYHGNLTREQLPCYLYWGSAEGFQTRNRTVIIGDSPSDALAGDFNGDGLLDLAMGCHSRDGDHATFSKVLYNDGNRFADPEVTLLPAIGPHWIYAEDMGHIATRRWTQSYESSVFTWEDSPRRGRISVTAACPGKSRLEIWVRSAADAVALEHAGWTQVRGSRFPLRPEDRVLQYKVDFVSDNGDRFPVLERVDLRVN